MAGVFEREAQGWADYTRISTRCRESVDLLTDAARYVIRTGDLLHGENWLVAGGMTLTHLQLARLFRDGHSWAGKL
jgi:hypothetical protein